MLQEGEEESYSSQCSLLAAEVSKGYVQPRNRIYRGLYEDKDRIFRSHGLPGDG